MVRFAKDAKEASINDTLCVSYVEYFVTPKFLVSLNTWSLHAEDLWRWIHAVTVASTRETVALPTEKSNYRTSERFTTRHALHEDKVWLELGTKKVQQALRRSTFLFPYSEGDQSILHPFLRLMKDVLISVLFLNGPSLLQTIMKPVSGHSASTKGLPQSVFAVSAAFETLLSPHLFPVVNNLIQKILSGHIYYLSLVT